MHEVKKIAEGAEAHIFQTKVLGAPAVIKRRSSKSYRIKALDDQIRKERTRIEARVMQRAYSYGISVPKLFGVDSFSIYMEMIEGKLLKDTKVSSIFFEKIGLALAHLHNVDIIHGDFTPANVMVTKKGMCIIDFGLSEISKSEEEKALDVLLMKRATSKKEYSSFIEGYTKSNKTGHTILKRLEEIELRGRYQTRTLG